MRDLIINGVPLRDPLKMWSIDYTRSSLFSQVSRRFSSEDQVGYHGVDASGPSFFTAAQDSLVLNLQAANKDLWNTAYRALQTMFMQESLSIVSAPQRSALVAGSGRINRTFDVASDDLQVATARTLGTIAPERINERAARLTVLLERPNSFWQGPASIIAASTTLDTTLETIELTDLADSTAPIIDGLIRIQGPLADTVTVTIRDRGRTDNALSVTVNGAITSGQYILIDLRTLMVRLVGTDTWDITAGTDARGWMSISSNGGFNLTPEFPGTGFPDVPNRYFIEVARDGTDVTSAIRTNLKRSYLS
jgi:hypothetical protein